MKTFFLPYLALSSAFTSQMAWLGLLFYLRIFPSSYAAACFDFRERKMKCFSRDSNPRHSSCTRLGPFGRYQLWAIAPRWNLTEMVNWSYSWPYEATHVLSWEGVALISWLSNWIVRRSKPLPRPPPRGPPPRPPRPPPRPLLFGPSSISSVSSGRLSGRM